MDRGYQQTGERRLTPEERQLRVKKLKRKRRFRLAIVIIGFFLALSIVISPILLFTVFRVKAFTVEGTSPYTNDEIIAASGIGIGKSMIFADLEEASENIEKTLPYTNNVRLTKKLPNGIIIRLEETKRAFAVELSAGMYALANSELKVLELVGELPADVALITGAVPVKSEIGEKLVFASENETTDLTYALIEKIAAAVAESGLKDIGLIDVTSRSNIYMIYQGRIVLRLGDSTDIESKISLGNRVINEENTIDPSQCGTVDLTIAKKAYFNPSDFADVEELVNYSEKHASQTENEDENSENQEADERKNEE
ncbi:MAG: FtsQ-type POTRA domain-containing protein [Clostridia bacterium]|nr:FtsQ-type POTRA domain-containing protein [Clostridia bacterium]